MESLNEALVACIKAAGGTKVVGPKLWPEKMVDAAQRQLLDCVNEDRPAKLSPEQFLLVLRLARAAGCHDGVDFLLNDLGYAPTQPIEPRDEVAELQRMFIESVRAQQEIAARIERAAGRVNMRAVA